MADEKRLIDANALVPYLWAIFKFFGSIPCTEADKATQRGIKRCIGEIKKMPTVDAVPMDQYMALREQYHELRENFIDYVCSGVQNVAPYCLNRCEECVDGYGWCKHNDKCQGFNPAEVILMDGDGNEI